MNESTYSLIFLLAASKLTRKELDAALRDLNQKSPEEIVIQIIELRRATRRFVRKPSQISTRYRPQRKPKDSIGRVEHLLRGEANLTVAQSAIALIAAMEPEFGKDTDFLVLPKRESFRSWLKEMSNFVSVSKLLHHATQIRNSTVHKDESDWSLREDLN